MSILDSNIEETISELDRRLTFNEKFRKPHPEWGGLSVADIATNHNISIINKPEDMLCVMKGDFHRLVQVIQWLLIARPHDDPNFLKDHYPNPRLIAQEIWNNYTMPYWKSKEQRKNGESNFKGGGQANMFCYLNNPHEFNILNHSKLTTQYDYRRIDQTE